MESKSSAESDWLALLREFRALGGVAENVCIRDGAHGRGLFAIDPARPVKLRAPENLLLPVEDVVFENGRLCVAPTSEMGSAEKAWLEHYENTYSWGGGGRRNVEIFFEGVSALPGHLREKLATDFGMSFCIGAPSPERVQERFLDAHAVEYKGRDVIVPIVDLVNHGREGRFDFSDSIGITGSFTGEIRIAYADDDAFGLFLGWGFASEELQAFSISLKVPLGPLEIHVSRKTGDGEMVDLEAPQGLRLRMPRLTAGERRVELSFLMLGNKGFPRVPKGIFHRVFREAGLPVADEPFELVHHINRKTFLDLLADLEELDGPMVKTLRAMCRYQLSAMSYCYGTRQI